MSLFPLGRSEGQSEHEAAPKLAWYWTTPVRKDLCNYRLCSKPLWFAQHTRTAKWMPFNVEPRALETKLIETAPGEHRQAMLVDLADNHFATCPRAASFSNRPRIR